MALIEGLWDCNYCETTGILVRNRECPNCGKPRNENTVPYIDRKHITYVPKEQAVHISRKADWVCSYCGRLNSDKSEFCDSCTAPRTKENLNYFENRKKKEEEQRQKILKKEASMQLDHTSNLSNRSSGSSTRTSLPDRKYNKKTFSFKETFSLPSILIAILILFGMIGIISLCIPKEQTVTVQEMNWQRFIDIERYQPVQESDWEMPAGARFLYSQEEFFDTESVFDHMETKSRTVTKKRYVGTESKVVDTIDLGNGYFDEITEDYDNYEDYEDIETYEEAIYRTEDVYQTKYYYEIDKWLYERSVKSSGTDKSPYWGNVVLSSDEQISARREDYSILVLNQKGKEQSISLSYEDWNSLEIGQTVSLKVSLGYGKLIK